MRRGLLNSTLFLSLLFLLLVILSWARSWHHYDGGQFVVGDDVVGVSMAMGQVTVSYVPRLTEAGQTSGWRTFRLGSGSGHDGQENWLGGFHWSANVFFANQVSGFTNYSLTFPHWFLALLAILMPSLRLIQWRRQRRLMDVGHCPTCGYDLRATPNRCPECGLVAHGSVEEGAVAEQEP